MRRETGYRDRRGFGHYAKDKRKQHTSNATLEAYNHTPPQIQQRVFDGRGHGMGWRDGEGGCSPLTSQAQSPSQIHRQLNS